MKQQDVSVSQDTEMEIVSQKGSEDRSSRRNEYSPSSDAAED